MRQFRVYKAGITPGQHRATLWHATVPHATMTHVVATIVRQGNTMRQFFVWQPAASVSKTNGFTVRHIINFEVIFLSWSGQTKNIWNLSRTTETQKCSTGVIGSDACSICRTMKPLVACYNVARCCPSVNPA